MGDKEIVMDGFVRDEKGKWHLAPRKLPEMQRSSEKKSSSKKNPVRKYIPIQPIKLSPVNTPESKRRKTDKPVRAELFRLPEPKNKINKRLSFSTRQSKIGLSSKPKPAKFTYNKRPASKTNQFYNDGSPLLDINEAEKLLETNSLPLKPLLTPTVVITTPPKNELVEESVTHKSNESDYEFLQFENQLADLNEDFKTESPMSAVCTLLGNAKIDNKENKAILKDIGNLVEQDHEALNDLNQRFLNYRKEHQLVYKKIKDLLSQLDNEHDKENKKRRSSRIASQITITQEKTKFVISPAVSKKVDLRRSTLNKNLSKNFDTELQSPRMKKAVDFYNTMRTDYGVLCTPKLDRSAMDVQQASITRSLSRRIQKQCLLLQDTPH